MSFHRERIAALALVSLALLLPSNMAAADDTQAPAQVVWRGDVWVNESVAFGPGQTLVIEPGTTVHIRMVAPSCTEGDAPVLTVGGNLVADGNATDRIRFETFFGNGTPCTIGRQAVFIHSTGEGGAQSIAYSDFTGGSFIGYGAGLTIRNSTFNWTRLRLTNDNSVVENCTFLDSPVSVFPASTTVIRNNHISRDAPEDSGIYLYDGVAVTGNTISGCISGIEATLWVAGELYGNTITGCIEAINSSGMLDMTNNTLTGNGIGIRSWAGTDIAAGNTITGNEVGIVTVGHSPGLLDNDFTGDGGNDRADIQEMLIVSGVVEDGNGQPLQATVTISDSAGRTVYRGDPDFTTLLAYERRPDGSEVRFSPFTVSASLAGASNSSVLDGTYNASFVIRLDLLPELSVASFSAPAAAARPGDTVHVSLTVQNSGKVPARDFKVAVLIDGRPYFLRYINILDAGQARNLTFDWPATGGMHTFKAFADPNDTVREVDPNNDVRSITAEVGPAQELPPMSVTLTLVLFIAAAFTVMVIASPKS